MKIIEITLSKSEKVNMGNYQSKDYFVSMKAEVEYDADLKAIAREMFENIEFCIQEEISRDR